MVETPWALSVPVPNNEAILIVGINGRRPVVGPQTELLEFDETLEVLTLSTGTPKSDQYQLATCFLRVSGNRIGDKFKLFTRDFVEIEVLVSYGVTFVGDTAEEQAKWFNHKDYVKLLCDNERSRLRAAARQFSLADLYPKLPEMIRDTVLGVKPEGGHRPNHFFEENNMEVNEVEVLETRIVDPEIAANLAESNRKIVTLAITGVAAEASLAAAKRQSEIEKEQNRLDLEAIERTETKTRAQALSTNRLEEEKVERAQASEQQKAEFDATIKKATEEATSLLAEITRQRQANDAAAQLAMDEDRRRALVGFKSRLATIEQELLTAHAKADADRFSAVQPGLIEAIHGLGDKQVLAELASNLPTATGELGYLLNAGGFAGLIKMLEGSNLGKTLSNIGQSLGQMEAKVEKDITE
jgi:major vault protein